ncbi:MAG: hypothetical protein ACYDCO_20575 [Armatimonadota bacterium]
MQCEACGATLHENAKMCPNCHAQVAVATEHDASQDEESFLAVVERFMARSITPHARIIIAAAVMILLLFVLFAWHPWVRPEQPSPYSFPVPGLQR